MSVSFDIDDNTKISLFAAAAMLPFLIGMIVWLANIDGKATAANLDAKTTRDLALDIQIRLIRVEENIKYLRGK